MVANFLNWSTWVFKVAALLRVVLDRIAESEGLLPPDLKTRFYTLWLKYQNALNAQGINAASTRGQYYRGLLALHLAANPALTDGELVALTNGTQLNEPDEQAQLSSEQTFADLFEAAEQSRNGNGGPNNVRRAQ